MIVKSNASKAIGPTITKLLMMTLVLFLGGCATSQPVTRTNGAVQELMSDENYHAVRKAEPAIREWARRALHRVNDLTLELNRERER